LNTLLLDTTGKADTYTISHQQLNAFRPHKYPMILLEDVAEFSPTDKTLIGRKKVMPDNPYVQGHFPGDPVMPPSFVIESLAQACGCLMNVLFFCDRGIKLWELNTEQFLKIEQPPFNVLADTKIKNVGLAFPGDTIMLHVRVTLQRKELIAFHAEAKVDERTIATGELILAYPPYTPKYNSSLISKGLTDVSR
jgi:3-hydroxyacyl-[acyl-carrier-protein] dehydratase